MTDLSQTTPANAARIQAWLVAYVADALACPPAAVRSDRPLAELGFDSTSTVALANDLGRVLGREIDPTLVYDHATIEALAAHLGS